MNTTIEVGQTLYLLWWEENNFAPKIKPMKIGCIADNNVYFISSYNIGRNINTIGKTMFKTYAEAETKLKEWYKENHISY